MSAAWIWVNGRRVLARDVQPGLVVRDDGHQEWLAGCRRTNTGEVRAIWLEPEASKETRL